MFYVILLDRASLSGSAFKGRHAAKTSELLSTEGLCKGNQQQTWVPVSIHTHFPVLWRLAVRGKSTKIKCSVPGDFNLICWQPSNSPVVTLGNFTHRLGQGPGQTDSYPFQHTHTHLILILKVCQKHILVVELLFCGDLVKIKNVKCYSCTNLSSRYCYCGLCNCLIASFNAVYNSLG